MKTTDVLNELFSLFESLPRPELERALEGDVSDGDTLWFAATAIPFLSLQLPVGDPLRARVPALYSSLLERLEDPQLRLPACPVEHLPPGWRDDAAMSVNELDFGHFAPALVKSEAQRERLREASVVLYQLAPYPWSGSFPVVDALLSPGYRALVERLQTTPLPAGTWEANPRASVPHLVEAARQRHGLSRESATLWLQLLTLAERGDAFLCEVNGWTQEAFEEAAATLLEKGLVEREDALFISGETILRDDFMPLVIEDAKLELYEAFFEDRLVAPLGRVLPLRPLHELFEAAWRNHLTRQPALDPDALRPDAATLNAIRDRPGDDAPRLVFADSLQEKGEPLGEFIRLQCERPAPGLAKRERELLRRHQSRWLHGVSELVRDVRWSRGFATGVSMPTSSFAAHAERVFEVMPLLETLRVATPLTARDAAELGRSRALARLHELDLPHGTMGGVTALLPLLDSPNLPALRALRIGPNLTGAGMGAPLLAAVAACRRLVDSLETIELEAQDLETDALQQFLRAMPRLRKVSVRQPGFGEEAQRALDEFLAQRR